MQERDNSIETALRTLGRGSPPVGMEDRILHTLARHQAANEALISPRRFLLLARAVSKPIPTAVFTAAASVLVVAVLSWTGAPFRRHLSVTAPGRNAMRVMQAAQLSGPAPRHPMRLNPGVQPAGAAAAPHFVPRASPTPATNHPAPPLPLTRQEQLLVQLARHQNAQVQALLDPAQQNRLLARNDEEFDKFFIRPPLPQLTQLKQEPDAPGGNQ